MCCSRHFKYFAKANTYTSLHFSLTPFAMDRCSPPQGKDVNYLLQVFPTKSQLLPSNIWMRLGEFTAHLALGFVS